MTHRRLVLVTFVLVVAGQGANPVTGQETPERGMVWTVPEGGTLAQQDLRAMQRAGVEAVRTELIRDEALLDLADTLGLSLYVDLPVTRLPASRLADTLAYARAVVDTLVAIARRHRSIRAVGLARASDTSDSTACDYFEALSGRVRGAALPNTRTYYVTRFVDDDVCSSSVDLVLADLVDHEEPVDVLRHAAATRGGPVPGIGALGTWVRSDTLRGLHVPASPERQARYFEQHLSQLYADTLSVRPPVVFVYRWRDVRLPHAITAHDLARPNLHRYGLHALDGRARPALRVVSGIYTGRQSVFAFEPGPPPAEPAPWTTLLGWCVVVSLSIFYALSPRFRHMVPRYFNAHFFFREAVREGRDVLFGTSTALLTALGAAGGLVWFVVADAVRGTEAFLLAVRWMPAAAQIALASVLGRPLVFVILIGCTYVIVLLTWTVVLSLLSRRKYHVAPTQALMLVVWPRWPQFLVMVGAMVAASTPGPNVHLAGALAGSWLLFSVAAIMRTLIDLVAVTRIPSWLAVPAALLNPGTLAAVAVFALLLGYQPEVEYVWHAALRR